MWTEGIRVIDGGRSRAALRSASALRLHGRVALELSFCNVSIRTACGILPSTEGSDEHVAMVTGLCAGVRDALCG